MSQTSRVLVLVRHGETDWSRSKQHTGRQDIPLNEAGATARPSASGIGWRRGPSRGSSSARCHGPVTRACSPGSATAPSSGRT